MMQTRKKESIINKLRFACPYDIITCLLLYAKVKREKNKTILYHHILPNSR